MMKYILTGVVLLLGAFSLTYHTFVVKPKQELVTHENRIFEMEVENTGDIIRKGSYIHGPVTEGSIKPGQTIMFKKTSKTFSVKMIYVKSKKVEEAVKGDSPTIFLDAKSYNEFSEGPVLFGE